MICHTHPSLVHVAIGLATGRHHRVIGIPGVFSMMPRHMLAVRGPRSHGVPVLGAQATRHHRTCHGPRHDPRHLAKELRLQAIPLHRRLIVHSTLPKK